MELKLLVVCVVHLVMDVFFFGLIVVVEARLTAATTTNVTANATAKANTSTAATTTSTTTLAAATALATSSTLIEAELTARVFTTSTTGRAGQLLLKLFDCQRLLSKIDVSHDERDARLVDGTTRQAQRVRGSRLDVEPELGAGQVGERLATEILVGNLDRSLELPRRLVIFLLARQALSQMQNRLARGRLARRRHLERALEPPLSSAELCKRVVIVHVAVLSAQAIADSHAALAEQRRHWRPVWSLAVALFEQRLPPTIAVRQWKHDLACAKALTIALSTFSRASSSLSASRPNLTLARR